MYELLQYSTNCRFCVTYWFLKLKPSFHINTYPGSVTTVLQLDLFAMHEDNSRSITAVSVHLTSVAVLYTHLSCVFSTLVYVILISDSSRHCGTVKSLLIQHLGVMRLLYHLQICLMEESTVCYSKHGQCSIELSELGKPECSCWVKWALGCAKQESELIGSDRMRRQTFIRMVLAVERICRFLLTRWPGVCVFMNLIVSLKLKPTRSSYCSKALRWQPGMTMHKYSSVF